MVQIVTKTDLYDFGDSQRRRVTWVSATGLRTGNATTRLVAAQAPQPLSQYPLGSDAPGYRLEHTERGHIIGLQFGGPEHPENLVPMYSDFNGGAGGWGQLERKIKAWLDGPGNRRLGMTVSIGYPSSETAIPSTFGLSFVPEGNVPMPMDLFGGFQFHVHPPAHLAYDEVVESDLLRFDILTRAQRRMMNERWFVETSGHVVIPGSGRSLRSGVQDIPVGVGAVALNLFDLNGRDGLFTAYLCRPYAVLDYLWFTQPEVFTGALGFAPPGVFDNTQKFSGGQISAIRKTNIIAHLGYMLSDLFEVTTHEQYAALYIGSTDASAQVDHIQGKAGAGSNCFSNARLVSKQMNLALNQTIVKTAVNATYADRARWPGFADRLNRFWSGL